MRRIPSTGSSRQKVEQAREQRDNVLDTDGVGGEAASNRAGVREAVYGNS